MSKRRHLGICLMLIGLSVGQRVVRADQPSNAVVEVETSFGDILLELRDPCVAPVTVANFLGYVDSSFYDDLIFHRVIEGFVIQGGGLDVNLVEKEPNDPITNESYNGLLNERGTLAMARTNDPNSAASGFFINHTDNPELDPNPESNVESQRFGYCVFGRVLEGMAVVDVIATTPTQPVGGHDDVPIEPVLIERVARVPVLIDVSGQDPCSDVLESIIGEEVVLGVRIENAGEMDFDPTAGGGMSTLTFLLGDEVGMAPDDPNLEVAAELELASLAAGAVTTETVSFTAPTDRGEYGLYYTDNDQNVAGGFRLSEGMRETSVVFSVQPNEPDLVIGEPESTSIRAWVGETVAPPVTVVNTGRAAAEPAADFAVTLYISTDPNMPADDPNAEAVASYSLPSLTGGASHVAAPSFSAPGQPGTYYLRGVADDGDEVSEFDETNNRGTIVTFLVEPNAPDLVIAEPENTHILAGTSRMLDFPVTVENVGGVDASPEDDFRVQLYLATDPNFAPDDPDTEKVVDGGFALSELGAGESFTETLSFELPEEAVEGAELLSAGGGGRRK